MDRVKDIKSAKEMGLDREHMRTFNIFLNKIKQNLILNF
jgi:hypothetical protein